MGRSFLAKSLLTFWKLIIRIIRIMHSNSSLGSDGTGKKVRFVFLMVWQFRTVSNFILLNAPKDVTAQSFLCHGLFPISFFRFAALLGSGCFACAHGLNVIQSRFSWKAGHSSTVNSLEKHRICFPSSVALWEENNYEIIRHLNWKRTDS